MGRVRRGVRGRLRWPVWRTVVPATPGRVRRGDRALLRAPRHRADAGGLLVVARPPGPAGLGHAGPAGGRVRLAGRPAPRAGHGGRGPSGVYARAEPADLAGRGPDPGPLRERVGAVRDRAGRVRAVLLRPEPAAGLRRAGRPGRRLRAAVAAVGRGG